MNITDFELIDTEVGCDLSALPVSGWLRAVVPGGVHESLLAAGRIEHPYQDRDEDGVRWIEERDWWFRASFAMPTERAQDERVRLVLHGLDTVTSQKIWKRLMILLTVVSVLFVFVLVFDVLYVANLYVENANPAAAPASAEKSLYVYDDDNGPKLPFPVLNCALVFLALLQAPVVFFSRFPEKLD